MGRSKTTFNSETASRAGKKSGSMRFLRRGYVQRLEASRYAGHKRYGTYYRPLRANEIFHIGQSVYINRLFNAHFTMLAEIVGFSRDNKCVRIKFSHTKSSYTYSINFVDPVVPLTQTQLRKISKEINILFQLNSIVGER